ncbi:hypothetical protein [Alkalihalobacillus trypoxylicola]|uniref:Uncharacterized protein n=1 Tax=Alkalihalobacillus trypoxylicola TaxID=519424 RepID=A0A162EP29_9BACI|nr:hypothetical protein [Alkalihalobacillus trypoxylicola]KYG33383.1 hypothetical protein AZF04_16855 [Alkalihalobacillus trypoxylicola]
MSSSYWLLHTYDWTQNKKAETVENLKEIDKNEKAADSHVEIFISLLEAIECTTEDLVEKLSEL